MLRRFDRDVSTCLLCELTPSYDKRLQKAHQALKGSLTDFVMYHIVSHKVMLHIAIALGNKEKKNRKKGVIYVCY